MTEFLRALSSAPEAAAPGGSHKAAALNAVPLVLDACGKPATDKLAETHSVNLASQCLMGMVAALLVG